MTWLPDREAIIDQLNTGLEAANKAVASGPNPNYHPDDDLLIREFIEGIEGCTVPSSLHYRMPRSAVEAVIRRLNSTF